MARTRRSILLATTASFALISGCSEIGGDGGTPTVTDPVEFVLEYDSDAETVEILHNGGNRIDATLFTILLGDSPTETQFADKMEEVSVGDTLNIDVSDAESGETLQVMWSPEGSDRSETLGTFEVP
jgi:hypothetical protein